MFSKIVQKSQAAPEANPSSSTVTVPGGDWEARLQAARGNDVDLLSLAIEASSIDHKLAAVEALVSEEALRTAEREFRKHDRRVHTLAKQRYETLVRQRETRVRAGELIESAVALVEAPMIPANRLVELNDAWGALDAALIDHEPAARFAQLQADLAELMRNRGERMRSGNRWSAAANKALADLSASGAALTGKANGVHELAEAIGRSVELVRNAQAEMPPATNTPGPEDKGMAAVADALRSALDEATKIQARLAILVELEQGDTRAQSDANREAAAPSSVASFQASAARWRELPSPADPRIAGALEARYDEGVRLEEEARKRAQKETRQRTSERDQAVQKTRNQALAKTADEIEAAIAAGHLAEAGKQLTRVQTAVAKGGLSAALQARIGALQAEFSRLKGWQQWGGGRVRDDLVLEAEALAKSTVVLDGSRPVKLPIKQIDTAIEQLRARWKELDRLGGATSKPLWQRFEGALKIAYEPVAAHLKQLSEARQENLAARKSLMATLDAIGIEADDQGSAPDWKEIARALATFQTEWRKLGPVEHTVPHKSRQALLERMKSSVARLEEPLGALQANAQTEREQFILRAKGLAQDARGRDLIPKLRALQSQWQAHAKSQPLPRRTENLLWAEFKAATDAVMSQREAAFSARDAEFKANQTAREGLIARLDALHQDTPPADIKRELAAVDAEWRKAGEAPRNQAARLESRYRAAREQALGYVAGSVQRVWNRTCDALLAKLALCEEAESLSPERPTDDDARWESIPVLPARWEQALLGRYRSGGVKPAAGGASMDQLLLQLESAMGIPSPEAFQAARRTLKLLAMKEAMEGRKSSAPAPLDTEKLTVAALAEPRIEPGQRDRLLAIVEALRRSGAGVPR